MAWAPVARVEVMITGSISGVRPTAILIENSRALNQSFLTTAFITNISGIIRSIILIKSLETSFTPFSKDVLSRPDSKDLAMVLKYVFRPV